MFCLAGSRRLLGAGVLGDGLGALRHGVLGQLTGEEETDGGLNLPAGDGRATVVVGQTRGLGGDALEDVVHERVHDGHGLAGDTSVGVDLLQHLVDVDGIALLPPPLALLVASAHGFRLAGCLLGSLGCGLGWHVDYVVAENKLSGTSADFSFKAEVSDGSNKVRPGGVRRR